eukprot:12548648-Alexandrium_andersonii.AAC.1
MLCLRICRQGGKAVRTAALRASARLISLCMLPLGLRVREAAYERQRHAPPCLSRPLPPFIIISSTAAGHRSSASSKNGSTCTRKYSSKKRSESWRLSR